MSMRNIVNFYREIDKRQREASMVAGFKICLQVLREQIEEGKPPEQVVQRAEMFLADWELKTTARLDPEELKMLSRKVGHD